MNKEITQEEILAAKKLLAKVNGSKGGQKFKELYNSWTDEQKKLHNERKQSKRWSVVDKT